MFLQILGRGNAMKGAFRGIWMLATLFAVMVGGIGILLYVASVPADQFNSTHDNLISIGDGIVKISIGAIIGLTAAHLAMARRNGGGSAATQ